MREYEPDSSGSLLYDVTKYACSLEKVQEHLKNKIQSTSNIQEMLLGQRWAHYCSFKMFGSYLATVKSIFGILFLVLNKVPHNGLSTLFFNFLFLVLHSRKNVVKDLGDTVFQWQHCKDTDNRDNLISSYKSWANYIILMSWTPVFKK